jgi:hypothetical protein
MWVATRRAIRSLCKFPIGPAAQIVTVIVAIFGVYRYFDEVDARARSQRSAASLELIRDYRGDGLRDARIFVFNFWEQAKRSFPVRKMSPDDRDKLVLALVNSSDKRDQYLATIVTIASFFDEVAFCGRENVCDRAISRDYFCPEFDEFMQTSAPILRSLRDGGYNAGQTAIRFFADSCR